MKLSIITINYNNLPGLQKTMQSVFAQTFTDYEYLVIDGGSTDRSKEYIEENSNRLAYWVSEKDEGIYHAMNKGIAKARGEYLLMLNSGDFLYAEDTLSKIFQSAFDFTEDVLYGDVLRESNGVIIDQSVFPSLLSLQYFRKGMISHQAAFIRKELHDSIGLYDENLVFSADKKFFMLAIGRFNCSFKHLPWIVAVCNTDGLTCNPSNFAQMENEFKDVFRENFRGVYSDYVVLDLMLAKNQKNPTIVSLNRVKKRIKGLFQRLSK